MLEFLRRTEIVGPRGNKRRLLDEVDFSRLYAGGHYLSDLTAGAFLGTTIGDYELHRAVA